MSSQPRDLGLLTAMLLVVASMVGTGVFTTTGFLIRDLQSGSAVLLGWLLGGVLALCGALAYAELVTLYPENGGEYQLLGRIYHPGVGFVAAFISLIVGFSAPIAASSLAFGSYLAATFPGLPALPSSAALLLVVTLLHGFDVSLGSKIQNGLTLAKLALIVVFIVGGLLLIEPQRAFTTGTRSSVDAALSPLFAIGLIYISFAYSGWNGAAYIAGEVKDPGRTLPRALLLGTALVTLLYIGLNLVFLAAVPANELSGVLEVGKLAAVRLFGPQAGRLLSGAIALALVSAVSAMVMAGSRVYQAVGDDFPVFAVLNRRSKRGGPLVAVVLQSSVALAMLFSASFTSILTYIGFTLSISAGLTVFGVFVLRIREPGLHRPYRTWGYPLTPALFLLLSGWMVAWAVLKRPLIALAGLATLLVGLLLYLVSRRR